MTSTDITLKAIGYARNIYTTKFAIPRQSGLVNQVTTEIVISPEYSDINAFRGIEGYSHLWLLWGFSEVSQEKWSPTVRPPRLGGNVRKGVFASRSPFRPNPIGLSSVKFKEILQDKDGKIILLIEGADLMDGTPIYDIKPYLPYTDCHEDAASGFSDNQADKLAVTIPKDLLQKMPKNMRDALIAVLAEDPRPAYQQSPERIYGFQFGSFEIKFKVRGQSLVVTEIETITSTHVICHNE